MGFVATPELGHEAVALGVQALARLSHRGGLDADGKSGDGAGLLIQVPHRLLGGDFAVAALFSWDERAKDVVAESLSAGGMQLLEWRKVPVDVDSLGERAQATRPAIWHGLIARLDIDPDEFERRLYVARRRAEKRADAEGIRMYLPSLSSRTLVYKGLMAGTRLADFYLDLKDPATESRLSVFHQRYSTNTMPDWRNAQPFRMLAHNGEINTITGNRAWMRAREAELEPELRGVIWPEGSDSASLDNALELLVNRGWEVSEALMSLVPNAWEGRGDLASSVRDFYRYQSIRFEPWDGPAALAFSDGVVVGAALDRNGLRPLRWQRTKDGLVAAASEAGVVTMAPESVVERGRLGPGQMLLVDTRDNSLLRDADAKERAASRHDYGLLADRILVPVERHHKDLDALEDIAAHHRRHGWGAEARVLDGRRHPHRVTGPHAAPRLRLSAPAFRAGHQPGDRPAAREGGHVFARSAWPSARHSRTGRRARPRAAPPAPSRSPDDHISSRARLASARRRRAGTSARRSDCARCDLRPG
jgi:glutamate synthase domain-containing protein 1